MKELRCPTCHSTIQLDQVAEDEALRELMAALADLPREASRPLVAYIGLFRAPSRATAYERQLRLAREVLQLATDMVLLGAALSETVEAIRSKRDQGENRPLKNHNYLKRVLESLGARGAGSVVTTDSEAQQVPRMTSKTALALNKLRGDR